MEQGQFMCDMCSLTGPHTQKDSDAAAAKSLQSCPTLCDPIDGSTPGSAVLGILQARTLEWVAIAFSQKDSTSNLMLSCHYLIF